LASSLTITVLKEHIPSCMDRNLLPHAHLPKGKNNTYANW